MNRFSLTYLGLFLLLLSVLSFFNIIYSYYFNLYLNIDAYVYTLITSLFLGSTFLIKKKIDDLIDPRMTTVSSILKHVHKGSIETAYTILNGEYEVIEAEIIETSELINKELKNSNLPDEIRIGAVLRKDEIIIPRSNFVFKNEDIVVFLAKRDQLSIVENMFRLSSV